MFHHHQVVPNGDIRLQKSLSGIRCLLHGTLQSPCAAHFLIPKLPWRVRWREVFRSADRFHDVFGSLEDAHGQAINDFVFEALVEESFAGFLTSLWQLFGHVPEQPEEFR